MKTYGSGQTSGLPLALTTSPKVVHTFPIGGATPHRLRLMAMNLDPSQPAVLHCEILNSAAAVIAAFDVVVPHGADAFDVLSKANAGAIDSELVMNGTAVLKCWADAVGLLLVSAVVDNQSDTGGIASQNIASGLIAAVRNASRFAVGAMGGVGQATRANGEIQITRDGTLRNLRAVASATIDGGATVTVAVFVNGSASLLTLDLAAADTTVAKTAALGVAVSAGDLVTFSVATDDAGAPAANIQASAEFV